MDEKNKDMEQAVPTPQLSLNPVLAGQPVPEIPKLEPEENSAPAGERATAENPAQTPPPRQEAPTGQQTYQPNPFQQIPPQYSAPQPGPQRVRRVGTVTMGLTLIGVGVLFLMSLLFHNVEVSYWLRFSPAILVFLGIEILISNFSRKNDKLKYDFLSIFFSFVLIFGSLGAAVVTEGFDYYKKYILPQRTYSGQVPKEIILEEGEALEFRMGSRYNGEEDVTYLVKIARDGNETILFKGITQEELYDRLNEVYDSYNDTYNAMSGEYNDQLAERQDEYEQHLAQQQEDFEQRLAEMQEDYERRLAEQQENYNEQLTSLTEQFENQINDLIDNQ